MRQNVKWPLTWIVLGTTLLIVAVSTWYGILPRRYSDIASVDFARGSQPRVVTFHVKDSFGNPLSGVQVAVETNSGTEDGTTDPTGSASLHLSEPDIIGIYLADTKLVEWPFLFGLDAAAGATVIITVKDTATKVSSPTPPAR